MRLYRLGMLLVVLLVVAGCAGSLSAVTAVPAGASLHSGQATTFVTEAIDGNGSALCNLEIKFSVDDPAAGAFAPTAGTAPRPLPGAPCVGQVRTTFTAAPVDHTVTTQARFRCDPPWRGDASAYATITVHPPLGNSLPPGTVVGAAGVTLPNDWIRVAPSTSDPDKWTYIVDGLDGNQAPNQLIGNLMVTFGVAVSKPTVSIAQSSTTCNVVETATTGTIWNIFCPTAGNPASRIVFSVTAPDRARGGTATFVATDRWSTTHTATATGPKP